ncbi:3-deoxy-manno-octulosonate cytidylyltransferase [uncultured Helicobacter sp.]|uniref:3-deoxy-manno-octulosonate cytidylyltransferase n=1 Tax=uncultured Helicobacter sp. TaxID=175537 RepID=UPI00374E4541
MRIIGVIPARFASSRFPGKPLVLINGVPMLKRTFTQALGAKSLDALIVATDSEEIECYCHSQAIPVMMTSPTHLTGTDRVAEVATRLPADLYINIQGDEPLIQPQSIEEVIAEFASYGDSYMAYNLYKSADSKEAQSPHTIKVITNAQDELLYMSRALIPHSKQGKEVMYKKQVCVYGFSPQALKIFARHKKTYNESYEDIEILRFLELGFKVKMKETQYSSISVDTPSDVARVKEALRTASSKPNFGGGVNRYTLTRQKSESKGDSLSTSDSNLPENLAYRKDIYLERLDDALTPKILESRKDCSVCARSGGNGGLAHIADTQVLPRKTCNKTMERVA